MKGENITSYSSMMDFYNKNSTLPYFTGEGTFIRNSKELDPELIEFFVAVIKLVIDLPVYSYRIDIKKSGDAYSYSIRVLNPYTNRAFIVNFNSENSFVEVKPIVSEVEGMIIQGYVIGYDEDLSIYDELFIGVKDGTLDWENDWEDDDYFISNMANALRNVIL